MHDYTKSYQKKHKHDTSKIVRVLLYDLLPEVKLNLFFLFDSAYPESVDLICSLCVVGGLKMCGVCVYPED